MADIVAACEANWPRHSGDCSGFARAVAAACKVPLQGLANQIVDTIRGGSGWVKLSSAQQAVAQAQQGNLVIAGLKGSEQSKPGAHGHVVVVVPGPMASGKYPTAYWGMLGGVGRKAATLNYSWNNADRDKITYAAYTTAAVPDGEQPPPADQAPAPPDQPASGQPYPVHNQVETVTPGGGTVTPPNVATETAPEPSTGTFDAEEGVTGAGYGVARIGDLMTHNARVIIGSTTREVNGMPVARLGDLVRCPAHGLQRIVICIPSPVTEGQPTAHVNATASCGAIVLIGSENVDLGDTAGPSISYVHNGETIRYGERDMAYAGDDDDPAGLPLAIWPKPTGTPSATDQARARANTPDAPDAQDRDDSPAGEKPPTPTDCADVGTNPSGSFQLSPNFTLAQLTTATAISRASLVAQHGLSIPDLVCNLKAVAVNVCEPVAAKYGRGSMIITSGFRPGSGTSQHQRGQAVDIQFGGISDAEYWERAKWVKDSVPYDQFILEYLGNRPWFHLSFSRSQQRRQVLTAIPGKGYQAGLIRYA